MQNEAGRHCRRDEDHANEAVANASEIAKEIKVMQLHEDFGVLLLDVEHVASETIAGASYGSPDENKHRESRLSSVQL